MTVLALDASGQTAGAALTADSGTIAEFSINCGLTHSQTLMPLVNHIVELTGFDLRNADLIACTSGPGSFTGLRIGAACAKGLAAGLGKKMVMVPTLDALAYNVFKSEGIVAPVMDARRGEVYYAFYEWHGSTLSRLTDYGAANAEQVALEAKGYGRSVTFLGDGALTYKDIWVRHEEFFIAPPCHSLQRAASAGALALLPDRVEVMPGDFKILYVRKPQAEREYEERHGKNRNG